MNARDKDGTTALGLAVRASDNAKLRLLLEIGANLEAEGEPLLIEAAARGNLELLTMLLRRGNDPNELGNSQISAISSAVGDPKQGGGNRAPRGRSRPELT